MLNVTQSQWLAVSLTHLQIYAVPSIVADGSTFLVICIGPRSLTMTNKIAYKVTLKSSDSRRLHLHYFKVMSGVIENLVELKYLTIATGTTQTRND